MATATVRELDRFERFGEVFDWEDMADLFSKLCILASAAEGGMIDDWAGERLIRAGLAICVSAEHEPMWGLGMLDTAYTAYQLTAKGENLVRSLHRVMRVACTK